MIRRALLLATGALTAGPAAAEITLTPVWGDHAIVQRGRPIVVEGTAAPGARIAASLGEAHGLSTADAEGRFSVSFPAREASFDPLTLHVTAGGDVASVSDILVGDVWLCSGQSNMAFTVSAGLNAYNNIQVSRDPHLRMLTVPLATAATPQRAFSGPVAWQSAGQDTTGGFSAACYYMLKDLRAAQDIPMGAVHSSWGGSQIRAWLTPEAGAVLYGTDQMALLDGYAKDPLAAVSTFAPVWEAWWSGQTGKEPWNDPSVLDWQPVPTIGPWTAWGEGAPTAVGNVWFRRTIELTAQQAAAGGLLNIGIIDDLDATWVNGHPVGISHGWSTEREYRVPAGFLKAGANEIVFAASNSWGAGGMQSAADRLSFTVEGGDRIALADGWTYAESGVTQMPPRAPWDANAGIGVMHNKMIAPIGNFALKGAAWYQGESDVGIAGYRDRQRELFAGWRRQFGDDLRVLVVQLANYGPVASAPVESGWAATREDQRQAVLADKNAALVTAIDIGDRTDIHPANKVVLGERLALAAQGIALPMPERAVRQEKLIRVSFTGVEAGLGAWSSPAGIAFELCGETQESCRYALARVDDDSVWLGDDGLPATRVRYAWADSPVVNTYDARGISLPGFEIEIED